VVTPLAVVSDATRPNVTSATLDHSDGALTLHADETLALPPNGLDTNKLYLNLVPGVDVGASLSGATFAPLADSVNATLYLTPTQRMEVFLRSASLTLPLYLDVVAGAVRDLAGNANREDDGNAVLQFPDTVPNKPY
jgi:hypothetical protein